MITSGSQFLRQLQGLAAIVGFSHHLHVGLAGQQGPQSLADYLVIIRQDNFYGHAIIPVDKAAAGFRRVNLAFLTITERTQIEISSQLRWNRNLFGQDKISLLDVFKLPVRENTFLGQIGIVSRSSAQHNNTGSTWQRSLGKNLILG